MSNSAIMLAVEPPDGASASDPKRMSFQALYKNPVTFGQDSLFMPTQVPGHDCLQNFYVDPMRALLDFPTSGSSHDLQGVDLDISSYRYREKILFVKTNVSFPTVSGFIRSSLKSKGGLKYWDGAWTLTAHQPFKPKGVNDKAAVVVNLIYRESSKSPLCMTEVALPFLLDLDHAKIFDFLSIFLHSNVDFHPSIPRFSDVLAFIAAQFTGSHVDRKPLGFSSISRKVSYIRM